VNDDEFILWWEKQVTSASFALPAPFQHLPSASRLVSPRPAEVRPCYLLLDSPPLVHPDVREDDGALLMACGHTCCSGRYETTPLLPGVQV